MEKNVGLMQYIKNLSITEEIVEKVKNCNLDDDAKIVVLRALNKEIFELRTMISEVKNNVEDHESYFSK